MSVDHGRTQFTGNSELGTIDQNLFVHRHRGLHRPARRPTSTPVSLLAANTYMGIYATDTFDVTSQLSVTAGGRFNVAQINLQDETGTEPAAQQRQPLPALQPGGRR